MNSEFKECEILTRTSVLSIRIDANVRDLLEKNAQILGMKVSVFAAKVLEECAENWAKEYATRVYNELVGGKDD